MIIDSSAVVAILRNQHDAEALASAIKGASIHRISAATFLEAAVIADADHDPMQSRRFDAFCHDTRLSIEPVTEAQARIAREAYRDFGRGSGHPAQLNFGGCFACALAKATAEPLPFKGADFSHTDVKPVGQ